MAYCTQGYRSARYEIQTIILIVFINNKHFTYCIQNHEKDFLDFSKLYILNTEIKHRNKMAEQLDYFRVITDNWKH